MTTAGSGSTRWTRALPGPLKPWWTGCRLVPGRTWSAGLYLPNNSAVRLQPSDAHALINASKTHKRVQVRSVHGLSLLALHQRLPQ